MSSSFRQQLAQLSQPQTSQHPPTPPVPSSADSPASALQIQGSTSLVLELHLPSVSALTTEATQGVHQASVVSTSLPPRSSVLNTLPPTNLQIGSQLCPPAQRPQHFRPAISAPAASIPCSSAIPSQLAPNNPTVPSQSLGQHSSKSRTDISTRPQLPRAAEAMPALSISSVATLLRQLNAEQEIHSHSSQPSVVPDSNLGSAVRPDVGIHSLRLSRTTDSNLVSAVRTDDGTRRIVPATAAHASEVDIVCLSDDE